MSAAAIGMIPRPIIMFLARDEILVVFSAHLDALGTDRPNCGPSADGAG